jgi:ABC-type sugar transport system permease subunit
MSAQTMDRPGRETALGRSGGAGDGAGRPTPRRLRMLPFAFAAPALVLYLGFLVWPALQALWISLTDWDGLSDQQKFIGLDNYAAMLEDSVVGIAA